MTKRRFLNLELLFNRQLNVSNYIFIVFLILMVFASVISIIGNLITNYPLVANVKWLASLFFAFIGFFLIYINKYVEFFKTILFLAVLFLVIWPSWFTGGGDNTITMLYMFLLAIESLLVFEKTLYKWLMVIVNMLSLVVCLTIIYNFPHLVDLTHSTQNVFADSLIQISMIFVLTAISVNIYVTSYRKQHFLLQQANISLEKAASIDELSQVYNRKKTLEKFAEFRNSGNENEIFALMIDVDKFKSINDDYGHQTGDSVIQFFASHLRASVGDEAIGRYGGDEFIVFFTHIKEDQLVDTLKKIINVPPLGDIKISASAGLAKLLPEQTDVDLIRMADDLLLQAKRNGRNQIQMYNGTIITSNA